MASGDDHTPRRFDDRTRVPIAANRRYDSRGTHDTRDHRGPDEKRRSVPGHVSDPNDNIQDIERAIQRGQQESMVRSQGRYPTPKRRSPESTPVNYNIAPSAITPSYARPSLRERYLDLDPISKPPINPGLIAFLPGVTGCGLLITAIVLANWTVTIDVNNSSDIVVIYEGLFQVCTSYLAAGSQPINQSCVALNAFRNEGSVISKLEQATRGLVIIASALSIISVITCIMLGVRKWERKGGAIIHGLLFTLSWLCGGAGMGCYSATLLDEINLASGITAVFAGSSFYFGWSGTGCLLIASVTSFMAHCTRQK